MREDTLKPYLPLTIADFMAKALTHYYGTRDPLGKLGDFTTAPEISQLFGEMLGIWCALSWQQMGCPSKLALIELGPGRGTLMQDILRATRHVAGFHKALTIHMVETSPTLKQQQQQLLAGYNIHSHDDLSDIGEGDFILIANEFFDALPIHQYHKTASGWKERCVSEDKGTLCFTLMDSAGCITLEEEHPLAPLGAILEICPAAHAIIQAISTRIKHHNGMALIIDYGYDFPPPRTLYGDTLQAMKSHQYQSILDNIGEADITAHVDFAALRNTALTAGATVFGSITQQQLLERLGIHLRAEKLLATASISQQNTIISGLTRLTSPQEMGTLFKALSLASAPLIPTGFTL